jgi:copper chaperone
MNEIRYTTNINCGNCVRMVSGFLNDVNEIEHWEVDTENPDKILTIKGENLNNKAIEAAVEEAGFELKLLHK